MNIEEMQAQRDADYETYKAEGRIWGTVPREKIVQIQIPRTSKEVIDRYYALEDMSTAVSDILDTYGIHGAVPNTCLKPVKAGSRLVGTAVTVRSIPSRKTATQGQRDKDKILMSTKDIFYLGEAGDVLVSDFGGNLEYSNIGGQSCHLAKVRGFAGCIAYGSCRDTEEISRMDFPVFSCGVTPMTGKYRMECAEVNGPVSLCGCLVMPGDLIVADGSGVCIVPNELVEEVLEKAEKSAAKEEEFSRKIINRYFRGIYFIETGICLPCWKRGKQVPLFVYGGSCFMAGIFRVRQVRIISAGRVRSVNVKK